MKSGLPVVIALALQSLASHAASAPASVEILEEVGAGTIHFQGEPAERLYSDLKTDPVEVMPGLTEKSGENIACVRDVTEAGASAEFRCGLIFTTDSGVASPDRVMRQAGQ